jgi:hypothetical protein
MDKDGYFEYDFKVHNKLPREIYYVQAQYGKLITEKNTLELS